MVSDWERGKNEIPAEMLPKIEQLETWAAAGGGLDAARAEIARLKDRELAAQIDRVMGKVPTWQALGSRPVPLIQSAQLELGVQSSMQSVQSVQSIKAAPQGSPQTLMSGECDDATPCDIDEITPQSAPQSSPQTVKTAPAPRIEVARQPPAADPYATTIDWEGFVVELDGVRGISLRELVERGGLYSKIEHAVRALLRSGLDFYSSEVKVAMGRPRKEYLFRSVNDAIEFCIIAASPTAHQIRRLLMAHHLEFQRLLAGDATAQARLDEAQAVHERIEAAPAPTGDPLLDLIGVTGSMRRVQLDQQARIEALEARERIRQEESEQALARIKAVGLPAPSVAAPQHTPRTALGAHMARLGVEAGGTDEAHHAVWLKLYSEYERRAHVDLRARAKGAKARSIAAYAEAQGHIDALYALACELWPTDAAGAQA